MLLLLFSIYFKIIMIIVIKYDERRVICTQEEIFIIVQRWRIAMINHFNQDHNQIKINYTIEEREEKKKRRFINILYSSGS